jgi:epoxyqueuosine reductase
MEAPRARQLLAAHFCLSSGSTPVPSSKRLDKAITAAQLKALARDCGFELAGIARAEPVDDFARYTAWVEQGRAASMTYLSDRRAGVRSDPRQLLASAKSILCVGKLYNTHWPYSTKFNEAEKGWISRYAWGEDYHDVLRCGLERVAAQLPPGVEWKICVDTAPLLERSYARLAGLGWIAKNTCLINQERGSWFFLGELLLSIDLTPDTPPPERCGTCTRCIDACPTAAIVPQNGWWAVDSRLCISYLTIEHRGPINEQDRPGIGTHVFGCDICQDVCPWNGSEGRAVSVTTDSAFAPREFAPPLEQMAALSEEEFRARNTPASFGMSRSRWGTPVRRE